MPSSDHRTWAPGPNRSAEARLDRERPRRVHAGAERGEDADAPVAELVAEPLDHDRAVVGHRGGGRLLGDVGHEVVGGERVEPELVAQRRAAASRSAEASSRVNRPIALPSSTGRPGPGAFQNGSFPGSPGAGLTTTRSRVMSSIRHDVAPSNITSPRRDS